MFQPNATPDSASFDAIVAGGGLAGMLTALDLRPLRVALISYDELGKMTSSAWAQGGIAAAVGDDDSPALHAADTVAAGAGFVERTVAARLAEDGPHAIERMAELGVRFDHEDPQHYALSREAAHSRRRILRAGGDATGAELVRAVVAAVHESPSIVTFERARVLDVATDADGRVAGAYVRLHDASVATLAAPAVVLATGGIGGLYRYTTNPVASRGTGIAIAARAGAALADLEFVQFHPTALNVPADPLPLVSEAVRGEGAVLVYPRGGHIMEGVHPLGDLAPRDVVARKVYAVSRAGGHAYLDARSLGAEFPTRFPTVFSACVRYGIDPRIAPIPVVAAAHYHMGGVSVDLQGRTTVAGLYACGEVAATGVHGANRLASNSLLESVVYPERIAADIRAKVAEAAVPQPLARTFAPYVEAARAEIDALRDAMYAGVGVERNEAGLWHARKTFRALAASTASEELRDGATAAALIAHSALLRHETRGSHARTDFPWLEPGEHRSLTTLAEAGLIATPGAA